MSIYFFVLYAFVKMQKIRKNCLDKFMNGA